ncbi:MAG TPA: hypothetical protein VD788_10305, partial [Candidatus Polarisedimenticolaceae bacterium]|nr:hypothetical protein [Candidatus Polarisedimenticolaceae bacterium]
MKPWLVVKFGGTSVATAARWQVIADRACRALAEHRVWIVVSALAGVSDLLERAITDAAAGRRSTAFGRARKLHDRLADELGLDDDARLPVTRLVERVDSLLRGIRLTREAPPRLRAQILATGELCSTELGIHVLRARGLTAVRVDARDLLTSSE